MRTIHRLQTSSVVIGVVLAIALATPVVAQTAEEEIAMAPAPGLSCDDTSGYGSVEASRAAASALYAPSGDDTIGEATIGSRAVAASRVIAAQQALQSGGLGSVQEDVLTAIVAAGTLETAPAVDANRAATAVYEALSYGPARDETSPDLSVDQSRLIAAQRALASPDLGSGQEDALAARLAQFRAVELALGSTLGVQQSDLPACDVAG